MTREEKIICKEFLNYADKTHSCNEYKLLMNLIEQETVSKEVYDHEYFLRKEFELKIDKLQRQLEKIRAEIEKWHREGTNWSDMRLMEIEDIIDKDKAESEKNT